MSASTEQPLQLQHSLMEVPPPPTTPVLSASNTLVDLNEAMLMRSIGSDFRQQSPALSDQQRLQLSFVHQRPPPPPVRGLGDVGDGSIGRGHVAAGYPTLASEAAGTLLAGDGLAAAVAAAGVSASSYEGDHEDFDDEEEEDAGAEGGNSRAWSLVWWVVSALGRNLLALLRVLCSLLDRATEDYRKIKDQMMQSKLEAKDERLGESAVDAQGGVELSIRPYPEECIQEDEDSSDVPLEPLPEPQTLGQAAGQLLLLLQYLLFSRLTPLCYVAMVTYHLLNCTVFSLSYPLVVFMWGMLSVPFPTKRFWLSAIAYTMLLIVVKYALQFTVIKKELIREDSGLLAAWFANEIGATSDYSTPVAEIIILGLLFLQRSSLKRYGLWDISRQHTTSMFYSGTGRHRPSQATRGSVGTAEPSTIAKEALGGDSSAADVADGGIRYRRFRPQVPPSPTPSPLTPEAVVGSTDGLESEDGLDRSRQFFDEAADGHRSGRRSKSSYPTSCLLSCLTCHPFREFFKKIADPNISVRVDLYSWMFISEFVSLLIIFFGYTAGFAGPGRVEDENIITYISKEEIPLTLTLTMFVQFTMLLVDRGLFLTRSRRGKFFFHLLHVTLLHVYLKFILPYMTSADYVSRSWVIKMFYASKCVYFALSAYQILSGYPSRVLGNFICKRQNYLNLFSFKIYLIIPFLFELRSVMDWMLTNTALSISHWLLVEDIYSVIFVSKCWRRAEIDYPTERAKNRTPCYKYCPGFWLIALIVACIWAPVLWFSVMSNVFLEINHVTSCTSELSIGSFTPLYTLRTTSVKGFTQENRTFVHDCFAKKGEEADKRMGHLLQSTTAYIVEFDGMSSVLWTITPPSRRALSKELGNNRSTVRLFFKLECLRSKDGGVSRKKVFERELGFGTPVRESLIRVLNSSAANASVTFHQIGDRFLLLSSDPSGGMEPLSNSLPAKKLNTSRIDIQADLRSDENSVSWWELQDIYSGNFLCPMNRTGRQVGQADMHNILRLVFFSERSKSENRLIQAIQKVGMYGILSVFVISIARVLRAGIIPRHYLVMYVDMPHVDRLLALLHDIYLVRESQELELEEELFAKLLYLFRSPSMLIKYTQTPESILSKFYHEPAPLQPADPLANLPAAAAAEEAGGVGGGGGGHCRKPSDSASKHFKHE
ncbi:hypothetical protein BOX15_Mlig016368g1 [Macrostomum lignano]|nr:hypothetical protein BOX15_Mlig016368g1 [Macrostomum lignano]